MSEAATYTLPSGARVVGCFGDLPLDRQGEVQRILEGAARRKLAAEPVAYSQSDREPESHGGER